MADGDELLDKADALMRRRRVFLAGGASSVVESDTAAADIDDLPVLTEVVAGLAVAEDSAPVPAIPPDRIESLARELLFERLPAQRQALADELAAWLDAELPPIVLRVLDGVTDHLVAQVTAEARAALLPRLQAALEAEPAPPTAD